MERQLGEWERSRIHLLAAQEIYEGALKKLDRKEEEEKEEPNKKELDERGGQNNSSGDSGGGNEGLPPGLPKTLANSNAGSTDSLRQTSVHACKHVAHGLRHATLTFSRSMI